MTEWMPMTDHPRLETRDAQAAWRGIVGPRIEIFTREGKRKFAQWRGEPNVQGGVTWAFWGNDGSAIGSYDVLAFRLLNTPKECQMPIPEKYREQWERDCLKWRGKVLTGKYSHWCHDWDGLPVDETTPEWPCNCGATADS